MALDLARHGAAHVAGGAGALAETLLERYRELGGRIHFRTRAQAVEVDGGGRVVAVRDQRGGRWPEAGAADAVVANLLPGNLADVAGGGCPPPFRRRLERLPLGWGAFTLYLGVDEALVAGERPAPPGGGGRAGRSARARSVFVSVVAGVGPGAGPGRAAGRDHLHPHRG